MAPDQKNRRATEDYLKAIYYLAEEQDPVSTSRIAAACGTRPASVTKMVQRLDQRGLVRYRKHRGVSLTDAGLQIALSTLRRHRLTELFLAEALGLSWDEVHEHAEVLEHAINDRLVERMDAVLDYPEFDPHGDPIPTRDGRIAEISARPMTALPVGCRAKVARIVDDTNVELLCYLEGLGLVPGIEVEIEEIQPFEGPVILKMNGEQRLVGHKVASLILMTPCS
jgi:DtxR family Mn-dependent transcriptional regulator